MRKIETAPPPGAPPPTAAPGCAARSRSRSRADRRVFNGRPAVTTASTAGQAGRRHRQEADRAGEGERRRQDALAPEPADCAVVARFPAQPRELAAQRTRALRRGHCGPRARSFGGGGVLHRGATGGRRRRGQAEQRRRRFFCGPGAGERSRRDRRFTAERRPSGRQPHFFEALAGVWPFGSSFSGQDGDPGHAFGRRSFRFGFFGRRGFRFGFFGRRGFRFGFFGRRGFRFRFFGRRGFRFRFFGRRRRSAGAGAAAGSWPTGGSGRFRCFPRRTRYQPDQACRASPERVQRRKRRVCERSASTDCDLSRACLLVACVSRTQTIMN